MNTELIMFEKVEMGHPVFVSTEKNKKGEVLKVVKVENWETSSSDLPECGRMYKVTLENGDLHFGWAKRFMKRVVDIG